MKDRRVQATRVAIGLTVCLMAAVALLFKPGAISKTAKAQEPSPGNARTTPPTLPPIADAPPTGPPPIADAPPPGPPPATDAPLQDVPFEAPKPPEAPPIAATPVAVLDPDQEAEQFVVKTRKEAADRIATLDKEARDLRAKLAKVEAASNRIKIAMSGLLDSEPRKTPVTHYEAEPKKVRVLSDEPNIQPIDDTLKAPKAEDEVPPPRKP